MMGKFEMELMAFLAKEGFLITEPLLELCEISRHSTYPLGGILYDFFDNCGCEKYVIDDDEVFDCPGMRRIHCYSIAVFDHGALESILLTSYSD